MTAASGELFDLTVLDLDGNAVTIGAIAAGKPSVLVFLRHFG